MTSNGPPLLPVGKTKIFGTSGDQYEVGEAIGPLDDDDWLIEVTIVKTGEKAEYRWRDMIKDPDAP
ncbi:MAG: DUF5397 family protein [Rubrivivax sp.]